MTLIYDRPKEPLLCYFTEAVKRGRVCDFCGGPLSLPCIYFRFMDASRELHFHPACAMELSAFIGADVRDALSVLNAHAGIQRKAAV